MTKQPYGIIVRVPKPKEICFVARPFDADYDALFRDISQAAKEAEVPLEAFTTTDIPRNLDFVSTIFNSIRSAKLIVAVCSPQLNNEHRSPNINVLYELGLADSLGKATIILSNGATEDVPSDIQNRDILFYANEEVGTRQNIERLTKRMNRLADESRTPDVLKALQPGDIQLLKDKDLVLTDKSFWDSFRCVLDRSREIQTTFVKFTLLHIAHLDELSDTIWLHASQDRHEIKDFVESWRKFREHFNDKIKEKILDRMRVFDPEVEDAFAVMKTLVGQPGVKQLDGAGRYWSKMRENLDNFSSPIDSINKLLDDGTLKHELEMNLSNVSDHVGDIKRNADDVSTFSGYVSRELLELFAGGE